MKKILFLSSITGNAGVGLRLGCFDFINSGHDCEIRIMNNAREITLSQAKRLKSIRFNGMLLGAERSTPAVDELLASGIPTVMMLTDCRPKSMRGRKSICLVKNDDVAVGAAAARHLMSRGSFRSYAFVHPEAETQWSRERLRGFEKALTSAGKCVSRSHAGDPRLADFLRSLQKPAGVFCAADTVAINIIAICRNAGLRIPAQVAVVGVDDDEVLCESTRPTLSSVRTADREVGRCATDILFQMMNGMPPPLKTTVMPPSGVTERYSSHGITSSGFLILEGLDYIHRNFHKGIGAKDVIEHLGVSPTLARTRFKKIHGKSIRDEILDTRLEIAMRMLKAGKKTVSQIAHECGYSSSQRMSHFFLERLGRSPSTFRPDP